MSLEESAAPYNSFYWIRRFVWLLMEFFLWRSY